MNELRESYKENLWLAADCIISLALKQSAIAQLPQIYMFMFAHLLRFRSLKLTSI
jgi:hypothetical protein